MPALLANTFGGYLAAKAFPASATSVEVVVARLVERMLRLDLLEEEDERIGLTLLGRACGASSLSFESCMRLIEVLRAIGQKELDVVRLVALVQILDESDGGYTPLMKKGRAEYARAEQAAARYGRDVVRVLQRHARDDWEYLGRCKRAAILADWVSGVPAEAIEREFTTNPFQGAIGLGDVVKFARRDPLSPPLGAPDRRAALHRWRGLRRRRRLDAAAPPARRAGGCASAA